MTYSYKIKITIFVLLVFILINYVYHSSPKYYKSFYSGDNYGFLSILESRPNPGKSIFFLETTGKIILSSREACAVESAARLNQNFEVYLTFFTSSAVKNKEIKSNQLLQALQSYHNVRLRYADIEGYIAETPVESLWKSGKIQASKYFVPHLSDVLRYLTLWKYGGIYLDVDVIVLRSLENLPLNYAGAESQSTVGSSVLSFEPTGLGHELTSLCLDDLKHNFNGKNWGDNGPGVITKLAKRQCGVNTISGLIGKTCVKNFRVYSYKSFFPVPWVSWKVYFNESFLEELEDLTKESYVIHMWNKLSFGRKIKCGEKVPYAVFAEKYCPKVYGLCQDFF